MHITSRPQISKATAIVREMGKEEFDSLMESMRDVGQLVPIYTLGGEVIDGRARMRACQRLKIEPIVEKLDASLDPLDVVDALNVRRRHLKPPELAMAAARLGKRSPEDLAALGISRRSVSHAEHVYQDGSPDTIEAAERGEIPISLASQIADMPIEQQQEAVSLVRSGQKSKVTSQLKMAAEGSEQATVTPDEMVGLFARTVDRIETLRRMIAELEDYERAVVKTFFNDDDAEATVAETTEKVEAVHDSMPGEIINAPKMAGLAGKLQSQAVAVGAVRLLFAATARHARRGDIGRLSDSAIAIACGFTGDAGVFVSALVQENWLQRDTEHRLLVVDWSVLCHPEIASDLIRSGVGFAEPTGVPKVREKKARKQALKAQPVPTDSFERFWEEYPNVRKGGRILALKAWEEAIKNAKPPVAGADVGEWLVQRAKDYAVSWKGSSKFAIGPAVWLNQGCWDDAPESWSEYRQDKPQEAEWKRDLRPAPKPLAAIGK